MSKLIAKVEQARNMFRKKCPGQFIATLADTGWQSTGNTKEKAIDGLRDALKKQADQMYARAYVRKGNVAFALYYANGWHYDIVRDQSPHDLPIRQQASSCGLSAETYLQALEAMVKHAQEHDGN